MSIAISLLLAAAQTQAAPAPNWRPLGTVQGRFNLFYDGARIERGADAVTVWIRREPFPAQSGAPWWISRVEIRCIAGTTRVVETVSYRPDGSVGRTDTEPEPFESIPAGSFVEAIHRAVC
jgi:hypothetical protein